jgi:sec-independent protein translocase protein TatA
MLGLGVPELLIVLVLVLVLFGAGRISKLAGELGSGIRNFREAMADKDEKKKE